MGGLLAYMLQSFVSVGQSRAQGRAHKVSIIHREDEIYSAVEYADDALTRCHSILESPIGLLTVLLSTYPDASALFLSSLLDSLLTSLELPLGLETLPHQKCDASALHTNPDSFQLGVKVFSLPTTIFCMLSQIICALFGLVCHQN